MTSGEKRGSKSEVRCPMSKGAMMPINHDEIIEELEAQIRKCGGVWSEWCGDGKTGFRC